MVFISILTPVYNGVEFLEQCIRSVRSQTFIDWDMWIGINGHGSDGGAVAYIAQELAKTDPRIHVVVQGPPLKGKVESLNHLLSLTSAPWISILDCDDLWEPAKLETQVHAIHSTAHDAVVIGTFCQYFGERYAKITLESGYIDPVVLEDHNPIINSSAIIQRSFCHWELNDMNFAMDDYHLWMKICLSGGKLYNIPNYLTWHQIHRTSAFNSKGQTNDALRAWYIQERQTRSNTSG
jgi:glycosyltransferase involved in cell wall biosynthesis